MLVKPQQLTTHRSKTVSFNPNKIYFLFLVQEKPIPICAHTHKKQKIININKKANEYL